jgi:drug/metabolite transporter (DMT)-like permease
VWGAADFLGGLKSRQLQLLTVLSVSQIAALIVLAAIAVVRGAPPPDGEVVLWSALVGITGIVGLAAFYRGLAIGAMGVVAPISASAAVLPVSVAVIGGERPGAVQLAGMAVAVLGVALASYERSGSRGPRAATGAGLALLAALGFGLFFIVLDEAASRDLIWALLLGRVTSTALLAGCCLAVRPSFQITARDAQVLVAVGLFDVSANALFALGTGLGMVSVVAVLASLYPVITIVLARLVLGERLRGVQRAGGLVALVGVALISAG